MVSGDAHLLGFDDGSHNDYANPPGGGFPVFQSSPVTQFGSVKVRGLWGVGLGPVLAKGAVGKRWGLGWGWEWG